MYLKESPVSVHFLLWESPHFYICIFLIIFFFVLLTTREKYETDEGMSVYSCCNITDN